MPSLAHPTQITSSNIWLIILSSVLDALTANSFTSFAASLYIPAELAPPKVNITSPKSLPPKLKTWRWRYSWSTAPQIPFCCPYQSGEVVEAKFNAHPLINPGPQLSGLKAIKEPCPLVSYRIALIAPEVSSRVMMKVAAGDFPDQPYC